MSVLTLAKPEALQRVFRKNARDSLFAFYDPRRDTIELCDWTEYLLQTLYSILQHEIVHEVLWKRIGHVASKSLDNLKDDCFRS